MSWQCGTCSARWHEAVPTCSACLVDEIVRLIDVLERLGSREGFEGALDLENSTKGSITRELRARMMFATRAVDKAAPEWVAEAEKRRAYRDARLTLKAVEEA